MPNQEPKKSYKFFAPKVFIRTFGCQMNVRDSEVIGGLLLKKGYRLTDKPDDAEVILFNTCCVRQHAEDKVWSEIGRYKLKTQDSQNSRVQVIGLIGCMAEYHKHAAFEKTENIDFVCGPNDIAAIPFLIRQALDLGTKGLAIGQRQRDEFVYNTDLQLIYP